MSALRLFLDEIGMTYEGRAVLNGITHTFEPGSVTLLMGQNGSGKSTLLRIAALLESPTYGEVRYKDGDDILPHDIGLRRRIVMVQSRGGIFSRSVLGNAVYGLGVRGMGRQQALERAMEALASVGLSGYAQHSALTLSSGESQRLAIARAIAVGPEVLFLDEPTASVDGENTFAIEEIIKNMQGPAIIMTTHDRDQAMRLGGRILTMHRGVLVDA